MPSVAPMVYVSACVSTSTLRRFTVGSAKYRTPATGQIWTGEPCGVKACPSHPSTDFAFPKSGIFVNATAAAPNVPAVVVRPASNPYSFSDPDPGDPG